MASDPIPEDSVAEAAGGSTTPEADGGGGLARVPIVPKAQPSRQLLTALGHARGFLWAGELANGGAPRPEGDIAILDSEAIVVGYFAPTEQDKRPESLLAALEDNETMGKAEREQLLGQLAAQRASSETNPANALREKLFLGNLRLVAHWSASAHRKRLSFEDAFLCGCLGLLASIDKFDTERGTQLSTYATWWIRQRVQRAGMDFGYGLRLPVHHHANIAKLIRAEAAFQRAQGRSPTHTERIELALQEGVKLGNALRFSTPTAGTEHALPDDLTLWDELWDAARPSPVDSFPGPLVPGKLKLAQERLQGELSAQADIRLATILRGRWGIGTPDIVTLETLGHRFGVTRERIRQLESKAYGRLRKPDTKRLLQEALSVAADPLAPPEP